MTDWTKEELSPHALALFEAVKSRLPTVISNRLRSNRHFTTHGSYRTLFLFDVWDQNQTDVLDRKHFKYCLGYDRRPGAKQDGYFHLWLNRTRIYRERESIVATLDRELPKIVPRGFTWHKPDPAFNIGCEFVFPRNLKDLVDMLAPKYVALISAVHPVLMPLVDQFTTGLAPGERRAVVAKRGKLKYSHPGVYDRARVREYTRSIPPAWRSSLLEKHGHRCALCGEDLRKAGYHIDHILAFSKGGGTALENLQPLCGPCNLTKGNR